MENVRQRTRKEVENTAAYAIGKFAKDLLTTTDILSMALAAVPEEYRKEDKDSKDPSSPSSHLQNLYTGVDMTRKELLKTLARHGVKSFNPIGEKFDPNMHQALFQAPVPGKEPGTVFQVSKDGYTINDRVLRPAQVGIVKQEE